MGQTILVPLDEPGKPQCYRCRHWDWGVQFSTGTQPSQWEHICNSPIENLVPGDCVIDCEGFSGEG